MSANRKNGDALDQRLKEAEHQKRKQKIAVA